MPEDPLAPCDAHVPGALGEDDGIGPGDLEIDPPRPPGRRWLYYLFFRPRLFFTHFVVDPVPLLTALACYVFGLANAIDRIETRMAQADLSGRSSPFSAVAGSWLFYWCMCLFAGLISAAMIYWIGGWWYRRRLLLCGADRPDKALSQRVYVFASLVWAFPAVTYALWQTGTYASPKAALAGDDLGWVAMLVFPFWSLVTSYVGVVSAFTVRRGLALLWFVVLPSILYLVIFCTFMAATFAVGVSGVRPNTRNPHTHARASFRFSYPGNWTINKEEVNHDPDGNIAISPPYAECVVRLHIMEEGDESETLAEYRRFYRQRFDVRIWQPVNEWGRLAGVGAMSTGKSEGQNYTICLFVAKHQERLLVVQELCHAAALQNMEPGFHLIRRTFRWR